MPLYTYKCKNCAGHTFEALRPTRQRSYPIPCPRCGGSAGVRYVVAGGVPLDAFLPGSRPIRIGSEPRRPPVRRSALHACPGIGCHVCGA